MRRLIFLFSALLIAGPVCAQQVPYPVGVTPPVFVIPASGVAGSGVVTSPQVLAPDGTSGAPAYSFNSEPTLGIWRSAPAFITVQGSLSATGQLSTGTNLQLGVGASFFGSPTTGNFTLRNAAATIGANLKVDALPTVASGFGTSPTITGGSTPFAGSVVIGTGGVAVTGVVTWGGTNFPSAPFCTYSTTTTNAVTRGTPTTTNLTLNTTTAWTAGDVVSWICVSSK